MWTPLLLGLLLAAGPRPGETEARYLHRRGVYCMEVIERSACAIERFESLLSVRTTERELVTDALLRLVRLYRETGQEDRIPPLLRRYWKAGLKHRQTGHVPYLVQLLPPSVDMLFYAHGEAILRAPITKKMGEDAVAWVVSCDPGTRQWLAEKRRWKRAERRARREGKTPVEVIYEQQDARDAARSRRRGSEAGPPGTPITGEVLCPLAHALGQSDMAAWRKVVAAMASRNLDESYVVVEIPDVEARIAQAVQAGRLRPLRDRVFVLEGVKVGGEPVLVGNFDLEQVVVSRARFFGAVEKARGKPHKPIHRDLRRLLSGVPRDAAFLFAMTEGAMMRFAAGLPATTRGLFRALLPRPKGLQVAGVVAGYFGFFLRMPSDNPVKTAFLVRLGNMLLTPDDETDPDTRELFESLDVAQAEDKQALLFAYVLDAEQVRRIFFY